MRPLLPVGYAAGAEAYRRAAAEITPEDLSQHYTRGLDYFRGELLPHVRGVLRELSGGAWTLGEEYLGFAAGSDVDLMAHVVESVAAGGGRVCLYPGDWYGFLVGSSVPSAFAWDGEARGASLACVCVPSVRNGHFTEEMARFVERAPASLLNLNLLPTMRAAERRAVCERLAGALPRAMLSISFSRGFGLTASQLGVMLVHRDHPMLAARRAQWEWFTYFYNALAARAFVALDRGALAAVDERRRAWVDGWLAERGLPAVPGGSYYVRSFHADGALPERFAPLTRGGVVRLCLKPEAY